MNFMNELPVYSNSLALATGVSYSLRLEVVQLLIRCCYQLVARLQTESALASDVSCSVPFGMAADSEAKKPAPRESVYPQEIR